MLYLNLPNGMHINKFGTFYNGTIYLVAPDRSYRNILRFEHQQLQLPSTPLIVAKNSRDYEEMNIAQSLQQLEIEKLAGNPQRIKKLEVRIQQKIAFPFICIIFGLVGSAMGTIPQRTGRGRSFGVSIIVIFIYYLLLSVCGALAQAEIFISLCRCMVTQSVRVRDGNFNSYAIFPKVDGDV